jgi:hypothetical protein
MKGAKILFWLSLVCVSYGQDRIPINSADHVYPFLRDTKKLGTESEQPSGLLHDLYLQADIGYGFTHWKPNERNENESALLDFKTEGLHQVNIEAAVGLKNIDLFTFAYAGPVVRTPHQMEMFEVNKKQAWGLEKYTAGINLLSITDYFLPTDQIDLRYLLKCLLSVKFRYFKERIFGEATATRDLYYVPYGVSIYDQSQFQFIEAGEKAAFKCDFDDYEATIGVYFHDKYEFRIGYFNSIWQRPSEYFRVELDDSSLCFFGTRYEAKSLYFGVQTNQRGSPGFNIDAFLRSSIFYKSMRNAYGEMDDYFQSDDESWLHYLGFYGDLWYNFYSTNGRFSLTIGVIYDNRTWFRNYPEVDGKADSRSGKIDIDEIFRGYVNVAIKL